MFGTIPAGLSLADVFVRMADELLDDVLKGCDFFLACGLIVELDSDGVLPETASTYWTRLTMFW